MSISNSKKECKRKFLITLGFIVLIETPKVVAAWVTLADRMTLFPTQSAEVLKIKRLK